MGHVVIAAHAVLRHTDLLCWRRQHQYIVAAHVVSKLLAGVLESQL